MLAPWLLAAAACVADEGELRRFQDKRPGMGSTFEIVLYAPGEAEGRRALEAGFARIAELNALFTDYDESSEACRLSRTSGSGQAVAVSPEMWEVLRRGFEIGTASDGAFDVTVGPLTKLWRRARRQHKLPDPERFEPARAAVGWKHVRFNAEKRTVELTAPNMRLDFGGIATGYAGDQVLKLLRTMGVRRALVNGSGDLAIGDPPPGKPGWRVGIAPLKPGDPPTRFLTLANCGISTSGDAFQALEIDGKHYSHILDPHTGVGLMHRSSVTVLAGDGTTADALATALSVLGPQKAMGFVARTPDTACVIVYVEGKEPKTYESQNLKSWDRP